MSDSIADEKKLLARIQGGDKAACAECIELHSDTVYRVALRLVGDEREAEDVVQETFMKAFIAIDAFEGRSRLATWLYRIATNNALMRLRRPRPSMVSVDEPVLTTDGFEIPRQLFDWCCLPEDDFETQETRQQLEGAIQGLPDKMRSVFILRELEGLSTQETAEVLDVSLEVVKTRLHRARLQLRERLADYFTEYNNVRLE